MKIGPVTSLYLLCCILHIVKMKDLANTVAATLFCPLEAFIPCSEAKLNGHVSGYGFPHENQKPDNDNHCPPKVLHGGLMVTIQNSSSPSEIHSEDDVLQHHFNGSQSALREALLSYITNGDDVQVFGSLSMLATLLQTKELEESMLDALGILPQRKQQKNEMELKSRVACYHVRPKLLLGLGWLATMMKLKSPSLLFGHHCIPFYLLSITLTFKQNWKLQNQWYLDMHRFHCPRMLSLTMDAK